MVCGLFAFEVWAAELRHFPQMRHFPGTKNPSFRARYPIRTGSLSKQSCPCNREAKREL